MRNVENAAKIQILAKRHKLILMSVLILKTRMINVTMLIKLSTHNNHRIRLNSLNWPAINLVNPQNKILILSLRKLWIAKYIAQVDLRTVVLLMNNIANALAYMNLNVLLSTSGVMNLWKLFTLVMKILMMKLLIVNNVLLILINKIANYTVYSQERKYFVI